MATKNQPRDGTRSKKRTIRETSDERVVVGSEIGVTLPVGDTTAHLRFSFWSERYAKDSSRKSVREAAEACDEFNEAELERRLGKHLRMIHQAVDEIENGEDDDPKDSKPKSNKVSVRDRAKKRLKT
jgi:hypothetical protein